MALTFKEKLFNELEKNISPFNYDFVIQSDTETKGKVYIMNGFMSILSFTYNFNHRSFSLTFYEQGQEPILGKPYLPLKVENLPFTDHDKIIEFLSNFKSHLENINSSLKTA